MSMHSVKSTKSLLCTLNYFAFKKKKKKKKREICRPHFAVRAMPRIRGVLLFLLLLVNNALLARASSSTLASSSEAAAAGWALWGASISVAVRLLSLLLSI